MSDEPVETPEEPVAPEEPPLAPEPELPAEEPETPTEAPQDEEPTETAPSRVRWTDGGDEFFAGPGEAIPDNAEEV